MNFPWFFAFIRAVAVLLALSVIAFVLRVLFYRFFINAAKQPMREMSRLTTQKLVGDMQSESFSKEKKWYVVGYQEVSSLRFKISNLCASYLQYPTIQNLCAALSLSADGGSRTSSSQLSVQCSRRTAVSNEYRLRHVSIPLSSALSQSVVFIVSDKFFQDSGSGVVLNEGLFLHELSHYFCALSLSAQVDSMASNSLPRPNNESIKGTLDFLRSYRAKLVFSEIKDCSESQLLEATKAVTHEQRFVGLSSCVRGLYKRFEVMLFQYGFYEKNFMNFCAKERPGGSDAKEFHMCSVGVLPKYELKSVFKAEFLSFLGRN